MVMRHDGGGGKTTTKKITPVVADREASKPAAKPTPVVADRKANEYIPAPAPAAAKPATVLDIINQANTFTPGVPASIKAPTQSYTVPATAPAPDFSRGNYSTVPAVSAPAPAPTTNVAISNVVSQPPSTQIAQDSRELQKLLDQQIEEQRQRDTDAIARIPKPLASITKEPVKYATPSDVLIDTNDLPVDLIVKLTLEKIGGLELISLVRHDTVNGQNIVYRPIKNVSQLAIDYNPQNIVKMPDSADSYFKNFAIKLENHIQQETNELPPLVAYIDPITENVIIETTNIKADYEIEVQMVSSGKVFDDTIYTEDYS